MQDNRAGTVVNFGYGQADRLNTVQQGAAGSAAAAMRKDVSEKILAGERGDWTPAERCREMVAHARPDSAPIALHVYPGAHHAFDVAGLQARPPRVWSLARVQRAGGQGRGRKDTRIPAPCSRNALICASFLCGGAGSA